MRNLLAVTQAASRTLTDPVSHKISRVEVLERSWLVFCSCNWQESMPRDEVLKQFDLHVEASK